MYTYLVQKCIQTKVCRDGRMQRCKRRCRGGRGWGATHCKNRYWCGGIAAFSSVGVFAQPEFINVQFLLGFPGASSWDRLEVSVYNVYKPVSKHFCSRERGVKSVRRGDYEKQGGKLLRLCPSYVQEFDIWLVVYVLYRLPHCLLAKIRTQRDIALHSKSEDDFFCNNSS
jgi:hypothetical protein